MEFYQHFTFSTLTGLLVAAFFGTDPFNQLQILLVAVATGTLIDLDHLVIDRFNSGNWGLMKCLIFNFPKPLFDAGVCDGHFFPEWHRYITHGIGILALVLAGFFYQDIIVKTAQLSLTVHLLCDFYYDNR